MLSTAQQKRVRLLIYLGLGAISLIVLAAGMSSLELQTGQILMEPVEESLQNFEDTDEPERAPQFVDPTNLTSILVMGSLAQIIFTLRFVYQWIHSEKNKESSLPFGFWLLSLIGSVMILIYAIFRMDPVLFIGHIMGSVIYFRNIVLLKKQVA